MPSYHCPRCKTPAISLKDKYKTSYWGIITCQACGARLSAFPWLLVLMFAAYLWNILFFLGMAIFKHDYSYFIYMLVIWLTLDALSIHFVPLVSLKARRPKP